VDIILSYCHHALNDRSLRELLPYLAGKGVAAVNGSVLSMGLLTNKVRIGVGNCILTYAVPRVDLKDKGVTAVSASVPSMASSPTRCIAAVQRHCVWSLVICACRTTMQPCDSWSARRYQTSDIWVGSECSPDEHLTPRRRGSRTGIRRRKR